MNKSHQNPPAQQLPSSGSRMRREPGPEWMFSNEAEQDIPNQLLSSRELYPITFAESSQFYLGALKVGLDSKCLSHLVEEQRARKMCGIAASRNRSRTRERSRSPSGVRKAGQGRWKRNAELAASLVDYLMKKIKQLPENILASPHLDQHSKSLLTDLMADPSSSLEASLKSVDLLVVGQCLILLLKKLGVLLPLPISEQLLKLEEMIRNDSHDRVIIANKLSAAQILLLNTPDDSRLLIEKVAFLFCTITAMGEMKTKLMDLAEILSHSLFDGESTFRKLKFTSDFIVVAYRMGRCPALLLDLFTKKLNTQREDVSQFFKNPDKIGLDQRGKPKNSSKPIEISKYFTHTKDIRESRSPRPSGLVVFPPSGDQKRADQSYSIKKRPSLVDMTKKLYKKTLSPFKSTSRAAKL